MRKAIIIRKSKETDVNLKLNIDGAGKSKIQTPSSFFNHLMENFSKHGLFDIELDAKGDTHIDQHHTIEDIGLAIGKAFDSALKNRKGIARAGFFAFPMDETLGIVSIDLSGRPYLVFKAEFKKDFLGDLDSELIEDFFQAVSMGLQCNIAVFVPYGRNNHHKAEAIFKAFGKAMKMACSIDSRAKNEIPSTKGILDLIKKSKK